MKKLSYFVAGLLIFSSFAAVSIGREAGVLIGISERLEPVTDGNTIALTFSEPVVTEINIDGETYVELEVEGVTQCVYNPGEPVLPVYTATRNYPLGTKILSVELEFDMDQVKTKELDYDIKPAPEPRPVAYDVEGEVECLEAELIYNSNDMYPSSWVSYVPGIGRDTNDLETLKTYLVVKTYPVRYSPATNTIEYIEGSATLKITSEAPEAPITFGDEYDLLIITPSVFTDELQPLINHKSENFEIIVKTTEEIYAEYDAMDAPEEIKYFIMDALEDWGITYVLLVGGMKSLISGSARDDRNQGTVDWYLPVRYTNMVEDHPEPPDPNKPSHWIWDPGFISDLYYADIYKYDNGNPVFDDWDSDGDGLLAEWTNKVGGKDILDLWPDVIVGRLACRNEEEVTTVVNKIINYENHAAGSSWYDEIVAIGGDSHDDIDGYNFNEGELVCEKILTNNEDEWCPSQEPSMPSPPWTHIKLYASNRYTDKWHTFMVWNIVREWGGRLSGGCGHLIFEGHANPTVWSTYWENHEDPGYLGGIYIYFYPMLHNGEKLPVLAVGGCHNSQFNVTLLNTLQDKKNYAHKWTYGFPAPEGWSWIPIRKAGGGTIAALGVTGLGYGWVGGISDLNGDGCAEPVALEGLGGYIAILFYRAFSEGSSKILGDVWMTTVTDYLNVFHGFTGGTSGSGGKIDAKTVEQWPILGDPTLKIGGYTGGGGNGLDVQIVDAGAGFVATPGETVEFNGMASYGTGECTYAWDFDNDGEYGDATGGSATHEWYEPGVYEVSLKVTDSTGEVDVYDTIVSIEPRVSTPDTLEGETNIEASETYTYITDVDRADGYWNQVYYMYDWGDGTLSEWFGPYTSGEKAEVSHSWDKEGTYAVRVIAVLVHNVPGDTEAVEFTDWSSPVGLRVNQQSNNQQIINPLFRQILEKLLPNLK